MSSIVDIHPHVISDDETRYPPAPLFGKRSEWSKERPSTVEALISQMDAAGVARAAVVHSSTTYGYDNRYVADACAAFPDRLLAVGSVDVLQPDAPREIRRWVERGIGGLRLFTGGSTKAVDPSALDDPRSFTSWKACAELDLPMCIQTGVIGFPQVEAMARRFPDVKIVLDHLGRPDLSDGTPYANARPLFALAALPNVYLKLTPRTFLDVRSGEATPQTFFPLLVDAFGAKRLAWGSNYPSSVGSLADILGMAQSSLACLQPADRDWIFGKTAAMLYPGLTGV